MTRLADLTIDLDAGTVQRDGENLAVSDRSFALLRELVLAAPEIVSHRDLLDRVWPDRVVSPETLTQRVKLLRQDLGKAPGGGEYVVSVHGRGYRLAHVGGMGSDPPGRVRWRWIAVILIALALAIAIMNLLREEDSPAPLAPPAATESGSEEAPAEAPPPRPDDD